jgi:hypothetical protein
MMSCMVIVREPGEVYVQGNTPPGAGPTTGWVERIDPESLEAVHRTPDLPGGPFWPGGLMAHANGTLYVTYGRWCHRLDADCGVIAARELPRERPYNSLVALADGHLVMKDFAGGAGLRALAPGERGSELCVLEPERLEIVCRYELPEGSIARLSADGDRVYVVGDKSMMRLSWDGSALTLDESWTARYLRFEGQAFGWDAVIEAGSAWFLDNGEGTNNFGPSFRGKGTATSPLHLVRVPLDGEYPEPEFLEVCGKTGGIIANPPAIDPQRRIAVGYDSGNGVMTAWRFGAPGESTQLWRRDQNQAGHMIIFPDTGELMSYDYDHERMTETCVVLDTESGEEKGRVAVNSPMQCVVFPAVGANRDLYVTTFAGVARVSVV